METNKLPNGSHFSVLLGSAFLTRANNIPGNASHAAMRNACADFFFFANVGPSPEVCEVRQGPKFTIPLMFIFDWLFPRGVLKADFANISKCRGAGPCFVLEELFAAGICPDCIGIV